jgi:HEAT repeat protein
MSFLNNIFGKKHSEEKNSSTTKPRNEVADFSIKNTSPKRNEEELIKSLNSISSEAKVNDITLDLLLTSLRDNGDYRIRYQAANALYWQAKNHNVKPIAAIEPLISLLKDDFYSSRKVAALALAFIGVKSAVEPIVQALDDEYLGNTNPGPINMIGDRVVDDQNVYVRSCMVRALGILQDSRATNILTEKALNDKSIDVQKEAKEALIRIKSI